MSVVYVHVGFPKCGSSSVQTYFTRFGIHEKIGSGLKYVYCVFDKNGRIRFGKEILESASQNGIGYCASVQMPWRVSDYNSIKSQLNEIWEAGCIPIFSQEAWGFSAHLFQEEKFFSKLGCEAKVFAFARPPVEYFNSGWWQWWAWMDEFEAPEDVLNKWGSDFFCWGRALSQWSKVNNVQSVHALILESDLISKTFKYLEIDVGRDSYSPKYSKKNLQASTANVSLSPLLIKLLIKLQGIRGVHDARVDSALSKIVPPDGKPPWILTKQNVKRIIYESSSDRETLRIFLSHSDKNLIDKDRRWSSHSAYSSRAVCKTGDLILTEKEIERLLRIFVKNVIEK